MKQKIHKAFITGGTGFIGTNLIRLLVDEGWDVTVLHRKTSNLKYLNDLPVKFVEGDVTRFATLVTALPEKTDAVFHLAASTNTWSQHNEQQTEINLAGTKNMINAAMQKKAGRFIHTSSIIAYGMHKGEINEQTASNAHALNFNYAKTKFESERIVKEAVHKGLDAVILNPANVIGPYDMQNWARMFIMLSKQRPPGVPSGRASFCHVKDVAEAHLDAFRRGKTGENYLLGGVDAAYKDVINKIEEMLGKKKSTSITPDWILRMYASFEALKSKLTGKHPKLTQEEILLLTGKMTCTNDKAIKELFYKVSSMEDMLNDTYQWLKTKKII